MRRAGIKMSDKEYRRQINDLNKMTEELLVVIDTAQVVLKRASIALEKCNPDEHQYVFSTAGKWVLNWKKENNK